MSKEVRPAVSNAAVLEAPAVESDDWIELEEPTVLYVSQDAMRFGPRSYSRDQLAVIASAVQGRRSLDEPPLSIGD
jgi:hypothetical protein